MKVRILCGGVHLMMASQGKSRRFLAVVLSTSLLWAAMACVSLCLLHCSAEEECVAELADEAGESLQPGEGLCSGAGSCCQPDCCLVKPLPVCALQKSSAGDFQPQGAEQTSAIHPALPAKLNRVRQTRDLLPHSTSDPPLARLCTLRI
jgi:hypothetical protein